MNKGRVGEERRGKETDGCPLTHSYTPTERSSSFGLLLLLRPPPLQNLHSLKQVKAFYLIYLADPKRSVTTTTCKATIHSTSKEVGIALVVMGKQRALQWVLNP
jgi:hypothetical protein